MATVEEVSNRLTNTFFGYFLGKCLAFPIVENYVKNTWAKYGFLKAMMNDNGLFFFKFCSKSGMDQVLEEGHWMIKNMIIILNVWTTSSCLTRDDTTSVPIWVKFHNVPIMAFSKDGLSLITSKLGKPIMLDAYTNTMCLESWGRSSFARALIEVTLDQDLKKSIVIAIPLPNRAGHKKITIDVEYEWKPPICVDCKIFGHVHEQCPKRVHEAHVAQCKTVDDDGFITVTRKGGKMKEGAKQQPRRIDGVRLNKPKSTYYFRPVHKHAKPASNSNEASTSTPVNIFTLKNSFNALQKEDASFEQDHLDPKVGRENKMAKSNEVNGGYDSDREEVEDVYDETTESKDQIESKEASTPASGGSHV
ncbi:zinc knuckle CX2CX4HX4C containing protein [Tanacetum coccineum]